MDDSGVIALTNEQLDILRFTESGHNVCIFGRAGVGKSTLVKAIRQKLTERGLKCEIVSSSGISCDLYNGLAKTIHSHYGLMTAELPSHLVIKRSLERQNVVQQVENTEVLIWDEMSMSSHRLMQLVNKIHQMTSRKALPFGGIQIILVGDFWQLKPIPSAVDDGIPLYESQLFDKVFPHRFELTKVLRQQQNQIRLKGALDLLRVGTCDHETELYMRSLARELPPNQEPVHIYFKRLPCEVHNLSMLASLPGTKLKFESIDTGNAKPLENTVPAALYLKPQCKVMLLYNINNHLKNRTCGKFEGVDENIDGGLVVNFPKVGSVTLRRKTWYKYDAAGRIQGSRTQYPLSLCYAITAHKSQSLILDSVVVHCSQEFTSGLTYVPVSRVRSEETLQVLDFH